jgi:HD superfamily phosphohydrolase
VSQSVDKLQSAVDEFADTYVTRHRPRVPRGPKIIHDSLWGTISLSKWEVALLDLPLLQRLRQIRQTSLTNYVFPGCTHSRFEHTLGVLKQTQQLARAVNARADDEPFDHNTVNALRLAALFHDTGHGCFSHISETVYEGCPDVQAVTEESGGEFEGCHAHEVLGALMLRSEPVRTYIAGLPVAPSGGLDIDAASSWIVGRLHDGDENHRYRVQAINGPFDADKLDYIFRDAHYSGLPLSLDLERLWASCDLRLRKENSTEARILVLRQTSSTPLEQILFNKVNLFTVVYQHPKVRAAECMFQAAVEMVRDPEADELTIAGRSLHKATDFLWVTDDTFFAEALRRPDADPLHRMLHDILYRRLFVRALTISKATVAADSPGYQQLRRLNQAGPVAYRRRRELAKAIWGAASLERTSITPYHVWVDLPPDPKVGEADRTYVVDSSGELVKLEQLFPSHYWAELYTSHKWRGHVFCPAECQQKVYEAAKEVLGEQFGLAFGKSAGTSAHVPLP